MLKAVGGTDQGAAVASSSKAATASGKPTSAGRGVGRGARKDASQRAPVKTTAKKPVVSRPQPRPQPQHRAGDATPVPAHGSTDLSPTEFTKGKRAHVRGPNKASHGRAAGTSEDHQLVGDGVGNNDGGGTSGSSSWVIEIPKPSRKPKASGGRFSSWLKQNGPSSGSKIALERERKAKKKIAQREVEHQLTRPDSPSHPFADPNDFVPAFTASGKFTLVRRRPPTPHEPPLKVPEDVIWLHDPNACRPLPPQPKPAPRRPPRSVAASRPSRAASVGARADQQTRRTTSRNSQPGPSSNNSNTTHRPPPVREQSTAFVHPSNGVVESTVFSSSDDDDIFEEECAVDDERFDEILSDQIARMEGLQGEGVDLNPLLTSLREFGDQEVADAMDMLANLDGRATPSERLLSSIQRLEANRTLAPVADDSDDGEDALQEAAEAIQAPEAQQSDQPSVEFRADDFSYENLLLLDHIKHRAGSGLPLDRLMKLKQKNVSKLHNGGHSVDCSICLEAFQDRQKALELPCEHRFHGACIGYWLRQHTSCPICRREIK